MTPLVKMLFLYTVCGFALPFTTIHTILSSNPSPYPAVPCTDLDRDACLPGDALSIMSVGGMRARLVESGPEEEEEEEEVEVEVLHSEEELRLSVHPAVGVLGSGDFSRSLCTRLLASGHRALVGSRDPSRLPRGLFPEGTELGSQMEAALGAERVVFVALFPEHYPSLVGLREALAGKVLVDVSNADRLGRGAGGSNAHRLARLFPQSHVVKGFNGVSAWSLQTGAHDGSRQVGATQYLILFNVWISLGFYNFFINQLEIPFIIS